VAASATRESAIATAATGGIEVLEPLRGSAARGCSSYGVLGRGRGRGRPRRPDPAGARGAYRTYSEIFVWLHRLLKVNSLRGSRVMLRLMT
jgi:hypothetical protein